MDHLPKLSNESDSSTPWAVPFVARQEFEYKYTGEGLQNFKSHPGLHGFDFEGDTSSLSSDRSAGEHAAFLQSWLYFGLLSEFLQESVDCSRFKVLDERGERLVSSGRGLREVRLPLYKLHSGDREDQTDHGYSQEEWQRMCELLVYAEMVCRRVDQAADEGSQNWRHESPIPTILLSITVLIDTLYMASMGITPGDRLGWLAKVQLIPSPTSPSRKAVKRVMVENGWCPFQISYIIANFHTSLICYLAQIRRRHRPEITHNACTELACVAFNIDPSSYKTRHAEDGCTCSFVSIPVTEMRQIVDRGGIPLAYVKGGPKGQFSLGVKAAVASDSYVAFSHVWSDGLGNVSSNSIPRCQLQRLVGYLAAADPKATSTAAIAPGFMGGMDRLRYGRGPGSSKPEFFWLDTLCIPSSLDENDHEYKALKRKAINSITPTFSSAFQVIILDQELKDKLRLKDCPGDSGWTELVARTLFSSWVGRCWTLEEGALARSCLIQCMDGSFDPNAITKDKSVEDFNFSATEITVTGLSIPIASSLWNSSVSYLRKRFGPSTGSSPAERFRAFERRVRRSLNIPLEAALERDFCRDWKHEDSVGVMAHQVMTHFRDCWNNLSRRQSSRPEDRLMILASLIDLNPFNIASSSCPMGSLLRSLPGVPVSILWDPQPKGASETTDSTLRAKEETTSRSTSTLDYNRWLPQHPALSEMRYNHFMEWRGRHLVLESTWTNAALYVLNDVSGSSQDIVEFVALGNPGEFWKHRVEYLREPLRHSNKRGRCFLLDPNPYRVEDRWESPGACLLIEEDQEEEVRNGNDQLPVLPDQDQNIPTTVRNISAMYDCPVRICTTPLAPEDVPKESAHRIISRWKLRIPHECPNSWRFKRHMSVQGFAKLSLFFGFAFQVPGMMVGSIAAPTFGIALYRSFRSLPKLGKIGIFSSFALSMSVGFMDSLLPGEALPSLIISSLPTAIFAHIKWKSGSITRLDAVAIGLQTFVIISTRVMLQFYGRVVVPRLFDEWLTTFKPKPPPESERKWMSRAKRLLTWCRLWQMIDPGDVEADE